MLYDRDCGFCRWSLAKLLAWDRDRRLGPIALQDGRGRERLGSMPEEERMASWHLVLPDGEVRSAGAGLPPLLRVLPGARPLAALAARAPRATERAYRFVAGRRSLWGRFVTDGAKRRADERISERADSRAMVSVTSSTSR